MLGCVPIAFKHEEATLEQKRKPRALTAQPYEDDTIEAPLQPLIRTPDLVDLRVTCSYPPQFRKVDTYHGSTYDSATRYGS